MEKLFCKTGITISLRCLLIVASLVFGSNAWGQINLTETIELTTFSSFSGKGYQTVSNYTVKDSKGNAYSGFAVTNCMLSGSSLQMKASTGKITSPTITSEAGFDITVTYKSDANFTISFGNDATNSTAASPLSTSTTSTSTTFTIKANSRFGTISKITLTPKASSGGGGSELTDRELSFGATTSFDAEVGGTFSAPTLTGVTDGVAYASKNEAVASVDAQTGAVSINGMGHATITASAGADATYKAGSVSYDIYVYGKGTIEDLKKYIKSTTATVIYFNLTSTAVVTGTNESNAFMEDGSAGIYLYNKNGHGLKAGNSFTGKVKAKGMLFKDSYELTEFIPANAAGTADIPVTVWTIQDLTGSDNAGYKTTESMRVKLTGVTVTSDLANKMCTIEQDGYSTTLFLDQTGWTVANGSTYNITGYPTIYNGTWEFKVIDEADLVATGESKTVATVTFAEESYTVETNGNITVSATTNSTSAIVYSISPADENVSINAETGKIVVGAKTGTYTITATVAENENFTSASANYVLTVTAPAPPSYNITAPTYYKKITSTDELVLGTQYIIANIEEGKGLPATGSIMVVATISDGNKANITDNTLVKSEYVADFAVLTLQKDENNNYVLINEEDKYLTGADATDLSWEATKKAFSTWKISFDENGNSRPHQ